MGIPRHKVVVSDPWFGQYIQCIFTGSWPTIWIGPMVQRPVQDEWIAGSKVAVTRNEKVVFHQYSDGIVTGYAPQPSVDLNSNVLLGRSGGSINLEKGDYWWHYRHTGRCNTVDEAGHFIIHMQIEQWAISAGKIQPGTYKKMMVEITFRQTTDQYTGVKTLSGVGTCKISGTSDQCSATLKAPPYQNQTGVDAFAGGIRDIKYWIGELNRLNPVPIGSFRSLQMDAFTDALGNTELADINMLNDYQDIAGPLASLQKLATHFGPLNGLKSLLRSFATFRLFWEYVVKTNILTANESAKLLSFLQGSRPIPKDRNIFGDLVGRGTKTKTVGLPNGSATITCNAKVRLGSGMSPTSALQRMQALGLCPSLGDVWDVVPYSFVIDWVFPIQKNIERAEAVFRLIEIPLKLLVSSIKIEKHLNRQFSTGGHTFTIAITNTSYRRVVNELPTGVPLSWTLDVTRLNSSKALTGAALLFKNV